MSIRKTVSSTETLHATTDSKPPGSVTVKRIDGVVACIDLGVYKGSWKYLSVHEEAETWLLSMYALIGEILTELGLLVESDHAEE
ncbi:MAG: hypothetical protein GWN58_26360 [Anaerolineae bacterium]|nr:hypothetical protein [Anaerolineae bacterium]